MVNSILNIKAITFFYSNRPHPEQTAWFYMLWSNLAATAIDSFDSTKILQVDS